MPRINVLWTLTVEFNTIAFFFRRTSIYNFRENTRVLIGEKKVGKKFEIRDSDGFDCSTVDQGAE